MSAPRVIAELIVTGVRVLGKATAAAGAQAVRNFKHKPEDAPSAAPMGTAGKGQITSQLNMSLEEAHLILNVKKDEPMDVIQKSYERIFAANGPPAPPSTSTTTPAPGARASRHTTPAAAGAGGAGKKSRTPTHSHYLHSKVYRALERIKAERAEVESGGGGGGGAVKAEAGEAGAAAAAAEAEPQTQAPPPPPEPKPEPKEAKTHKGGTIEL